MSPIAHAAETEYHYRDHDTDRVNQSPPVQNTWYEVFDAEDVRLLLSELRQTNDETAAKDIEVRWTIDGTPYLGSQSCAENTWFYVQRNHWPSSGGTLGLDITTNIRNAVNNVDKRGLSYKVEVRITSVVGTNQTLIYDAVRETQVVT